jgi:AraC family transcriptional regulator
MASNRTDYTDRINRVIAHIFDHLDEDIDLNRLAEIACLSPYHWHRVYRAVQGETITATVRRLRLHRAAAHLAYSAMPIEEIAERSGYGNVQSFSRVFSATYGMPPAKYRKNGSHAKFQPHRREGADSVYDVTIKTIPSMTALTVEHIGPYMEIGRAFETVYGLLHTHNLAGAAEKMVAIYYCDPDSMPEAELRSRAGVVFTDDRPRDLPLEPAEITGGDYAVLTHKGPYADMRAAYQWLYGEWLPRSGREPADAPPFEDYLNTPANTAPTDLLTEICLPLKPT